ncbi:MAG: GspMb/PilO family protein [Gemmatimonadota bacterium]|nr:GspMb/PilO family protein [Gemmatimonadota bacterium]
MKGIAMGSRDKRAVLLGLAILVPALAFIWGVKPLKQALAETNDRILTERDALSREQAAVAEVARDPARKAFADSALVAVKSRVFTGANDVAAGASLVSYLGDVAKRTHVWLASATTRPNVTAGSAGVAGAASAAGAAAVRVATPLPEGVRALRVELRAETDFQGILDFLDALERGERLVTIERLDIAKTLRAGDEDRETLSVTATVIGYSLAGGAR